MAKSPTNTDLSQQLTDTERRLTKRMDTLDIIVKNHDDNLMAINKRHDLIDAGKAAVSAYKKEEADERRIRTQDGIATFQLKAWHYVVGILGIVSAILYAIATTRGLKP